jgi:hypothetical protein
MPDDHFEEGLRAYADRVARDATVPPAGEIRRRATRRRRNQAAGAVFAVTLVAALGVGAVLNRGDRPGPVLPPASTPSPSAAVTVVPGPRPTGTVTSDVSQLRELTVDLRKSVLLDVPDDGLDRWLQYRPDGTVDFTGTARDASTEMVLYPAPTRAENSVQIVPKVFGNQCVAATPSPPLTLVPCAVDDDSQIWRLVPAGDSGAFELEGAYGIVRVEDGQIIAGEGGWSIMQTKDF